MTFKLLFFLMLNNVLLYQIPSFTLLWKHFTEVTLILKGGKGAVNQELMWFKKSPIMLFLPPNLPSVTLRTGLSQRSHSGFLGLRSSLTKITYHSVLKRMFCLLYCTFFPTESQCI